jgi:hypothetical protein
MAHPSGIDQHRRLPSPATLQKVNTPLPTNPLTHLHIISQLQRNTQDRHLIITHSHPSPAHASANPLTPHPLIVPHTRIQLLLIPIHNLPFQPHLILKNVHICTRKLPRTNPSLKQQIQLRETPATRFRHPEISINDAEEADACPEEASEVRPVPVPGVKHVRGEHGADDADDVAAEHDGLDLQAPGGELGDEGVADCADGELVEEGPD